MDDVLEIVVDSSLYLPEMFTILLQDSELKWVDSSILELGKAVEISALAGQETGGSQGLLMDGEITALEPSFSAEGKTTMLIRGYNKLHRLHRGKKSCTFLKMTDSDIVRKVAGGAGLAAMVDSTSIVHDYVLQNNQTDMEFLQTRAERLGYKVFAAGSKLYFKKGDASLGQGPELAFGAGLQRFRPILAATHQVDNVEVMGWDPAKKAAIKGRAQSTIIQGGIGKKGGQAAKSAFNAASTMMLVNQPVATVNEANALAQGLADDIGSEFIQAEGVCFGHPGVKAGHTITIKGVGQRFSGSYFVTSAVHSINERGYETQFTISGRQPNTASHLLEAENGQLAGRGGLHGLAIGVVTNNNSEKDWGRVKVKYPWLGDNIESDWIRVVGPGAGAKRGIYWLPEINDEVLLGFEHGDIHRPYVLGGLWNGRDAPPTPVAETVVSGKVDQRVIQSRSGHQVILNDANGKEKILIQSKSGHQVLLDEAGGGKITIKDKSGSNEMIIDSSQNAVTINAGQNLTLKCGQKLTLDCTELAVTAKGKGVIKTTAALTLESTVKSEIKGAQVSINGSAQTEVKGGGMVQIQGGLVKIN